MYIYILALLIGIVAGLRSMTAPAMTSWAANLGWLNLQGTWLAFLGFAYTPYILSVLALGELITDKLPSTPRRCSRRSCGRRPANGPTGTPTSGSSPSARSVVRHLAWRGEA